MKHFKTFAAGAILTLVVAPAVALVSLPGKIIAKVKSVSIGELSGHEASNCGGCDKCLKRS